MGIGSPDWEGGIDIGKSRRGNGKGARRSDRENRSVQNRKSRVDQLPISAVLGSLPISYSAYSAPYFRYPRSVHYRRSTTRLSQPSSYRLFSHFPYYPLYPSALKSINYPPPRLFELRPAFYRHLLPVALVLQQLWPPLIIATRDFLFQIDRFPRPPRLTTRVVRITFLFRSRSLLLILVVSFSRLLRLAIVWFPCLLSSPFPYILSVLYSV